MHDDDSSQPSSETPSVNLGFVELQISKAQIQLALAEDAARRERAAGKVSKWIGILRSLLANTLRVGSRRPVGKYPVWVTLEVMHGGFASGGSAAGGPLQDHERVLLGWLPAVAAGEERRALNAYFLSPQGLRELQAQLDEGTLKIGVPEEAALPTVAWLAGHDAADAAAEILAEIAPLFGELRFYPAKLAEPLPEPDGRVALQSAAECAAALRSLRSQFQISRYRQAIELFLPIYDRAVGLFLETVEDGWPCQRYPEGWPERAAGLSREYARARLANPGSGLGHPRRDRSRLLELLERCSRSPESLSGREVGEIRGALERSIAKRGAPGSPEHTRLRVKQRAAVLRPAIEDLVTIVLQRLRAANLDAESLLLPVAAAETGNEEWIGAELPLSLKRKLVRCRRATPAELVESGILVSSETLAKVLPQVTGDLFALGIRDPQLRRLVNGTYQAFRRRRSLLLLNYEHQATIEELPWMRAVRPYLELGSTSAAEAKRFLREIVLLTFRSFPHVILPNKLIRELIELAKSAALEIPFTEELAVDIFMGDFGPKFLEAAKTSTELLEGTLYADYYRIDLAEIRALEIAQPSSSSWPAASTPFGRLCHARVGGTPKRSTPAANGKIVEQQQILTTHNLAPLVLALDLRGDLAGDLAGMARRCFKWICWRLWKSSGHTGHAELIVLKNTAYAWRQMIFFLSLLPQAEQQEFLGWAVGHLQGQNEKVRERFEPVLQALIEVARGKSSSGDTRPFLGWTRGVL